ncbi:hypothetical protein VQ03_00255 [Methylobacterium tarhaniae]|uniref:Uncharacterized protein n=1 Tax=Methylobacterium tarhaniae TaxID=1187852 RepID=A0A0J6TGE0_9HYPH|nr:hypothetical protein [Methylobacterium tarhaniae]KMO44994.1 hypothetical protein VQ03_00255 [Methylobacterium tarhaniae]
MDDAMFNDLTRSLEQAAAHTRGETVPGLRVLAPCEVDVAAIQGLTLAAQIITTPAGQEFVILPRRIYDAPLQGCPPLIPKYPPQVSRGSSDWACPL